MTALQAFRFLENSSRKLTLDYCSREGVAVQNRSLSQIFTPQERLVGRRGLSKEKLAAVQGETLIRGNHAEPSPSQSATITSLQYLVSRSPQRLGGYPHSASLVGVEPLSSLAATSGLRWIWPVPVLGGISHVRSVCSLP